MNIQTTTQSATEIEADVVAIGIWENESLDGAAKDIDDASGGVLSKMIELEEVSAARFTTSVLHGPSGVKAPIVLVVGLGKKEDVDETFSYRIGGVVSKAAGSKQRKHVATYINVDVPSETICGLMNGCIGQDLYMEKKKLNEIESVSLGFEVADEDLSRGRVLGESILLTRKLVNMRGHDRANRIRFRI